MAHELPALPESYRSFWTWVHTPGGGYRESAPHYSADQMRSYALAHAASLEAEVARLRSRLNEVHSWIVCAAIASPDDMMQHAQRIEEITRPDWCTYPACSCDGPAVDGGCAALKGS